MVEGAGRRALLATVRDGAATGIEAQDVDGGDDRAIRVADWPSWVAGAVAVADALLAEICVAGDFGTELAVQTIRVVGR